MTARPAPTTVGTAQPLTASTGSRSFGTMAAGDIYFNNRNTSDRGGHGVVVPARS